MENLKEWVSIVERANLYGTNNKRIEEYSIQVESPITNYSYKVLYPLKYPPLSLSDYLVDQIIDFHKTHYFEYRIDCRVELKPVKPYLIQVTVLVLYNSYTLAKEVRTLEEFCINIDYFKTNSPITGILENVFGEFKYRETYLVV